MRRQQLEASCEVLKVSDLEMLDCADSGMRRFGEGMREFPEDMSEPVRRGRRDGRDRPPRR
ncbi:hypothetical protein SANTM175S_06780 [Streptomyces antimycoticus]